MLIEPALLLEPELTKELIPHLKSHFRDLLISVKEIHVIQKEPPTSQFLELNEIQRKKQTRYQVYQRTISDLCYRYNKFSKESLLRDPFLSFMFACFAIWKLQAIKDINEEGVTAQK